MILSFINIRKVPREMLKTSGFALGFQHLNRDLANVNEWKIMFDPYNQCLKRINADHWHADSEIADLDSRVSSKRAKSIVLLLHLKKRSIVNHLSSLPISLSLSLSLSLSHVHVWKQARLCGFQWIVTQIQTDSKLIAQSDWTTTCT